MLLAGADAAPFNRQLADLGLDETLARRAERLATRALTRAATGDRRPATGVGYQGVTQS